MATRTISDAGGNWNATATWVEGVVPTSADDVVATATSGQLTVNVGVSCRSIDLTNYSNTLTIDNVLVLGTAGLTNTLGDTNTTYAGNGTSFIRSDVATTLVQNNTNRILALELGGSNIKTLSTDLYVNRLRTDSNSTTINGNTIYVGGDWEGLTSFATFGSGFRGSTNFYLDGSGEISTSYAGTGTITINTSGTYNTNGTGICFYRLDGNSSPTFDFISGGTPTSFFVILSNFPTQNSSCTINIPQSLNSFVDVLMNNEAVNDTIASPPRSLTINTTTGIYCNLFATANNFRTFTSDDGTVEVTITGGTLDVTSLQLTPTLRTNSGTGNPTPFNNKSISLFLDPLHTHTFGNILAIGGGTPEKPVIGSSTSGTKVPIVLSSKITSQIAGFDFTDVDATGGEEIVAINGTITNSDNVTNVYPTGGGGGGESSFVFFS